MTEGNEDTPAPHAALHLPAQSRRLELWLPLGIVIVDQLTKALVRATLPIHDSVTIVPGLVDFTHVRNTGAAFGILNYAEFPFKTVVIALIPTPPLFAARFNPATLPHPHLVAPPRPALLL